MRDIKFRGKRLDTGEWVYGSLVILAYHNSVDYVIVLNNGHTYEVDPETVGQYTGRKDKDGVEIYEGDVLYLYSNKISQNVFYDDGCFVCSVDNYPLNKYLLKTIDQKDIEVIRDIHENPELLGEK